MPATEQTWRDQKRLHQVFAASCFLLLGATIWMFVQDHNREWKAYQKNFRRIQTQNNLWNQVQFNNDVVEQAHGQLSSRLLRIQSQPLDSDQLNEFKDEVNSDAQRRNVDKYDFEKLDQLLGKHEELSNAALEARKSATQKLADARSARDQASAAQVAADNAKADLAAATPENRLEIEERLKASEQQAATQRAKRLADETEYDRLDKDAIQAEADAKAARDRVLDRLQVIVKAARFREKLAGDKRKAISAKLDAEKANLSLAVRDDAVPDELKKLQVIVDERKQEVEALTVAFEEASAHRKQLEKILKSLTASEDDAVKKLKELNADLVRLKTGYVDLRSTYFVGSFPFIGKRWLEMPILDAFNSPLKIENLWDNDNTIDYNFSRVRRFDRCTTCHQAMEKSMPGNAEMPLYLKERNLEFVLSTPTKEQLAKLKKDGDGDARDLSLELIYGLRLAEEGEYLLNRDDVTISFVRPYSIDLPVDLGDGTNSGVIAKKEEEAEDDEARPSSLGAQARMAGDDTGSLVEGEELRRATMQSQPSPSLDNLGVSAGLQVGDVIVQVNDDYVTDRDSARRLLLDVDWGRPVRLVVRRGLPSPYTSHPRLDLFVGSLSPHKVADFACTICHDGQGSATDFKWASHTPNNELELERWEREYGWFDNHHWIFPMNPKRFAESSCLKCHHDVVELEPSEKFPDPPAPALTHGYDLVRKYGCYGCHEIRGYDGPDERIGPDMRVEPQYFAAAQDLHALLPTGRARIEADLKTAAEQQGKFQEQQVEKQQALDKLQEGVDSDTEPSPEIAAVKEDLAGIEEAIFVNNENLSVLKAKLDDLAKMNELADRLTQHPEESGTRHKLLALIEKDRDVLDKAGVSVLDSEVHSLADLLKDVETPGAMRKPGPSLRYLASKLDGQFLYDWVRNPTHFRPNTRMPRFFGLWKHLEDSPKLEETKRFEAVEVLGIAAYLKDRSQELDYLPQPQGITETSPEEMATRGKIQFQTRGCLACHTHEAFPEAEAYRNPEEIVQGPDLSNLGAKFDPDRNPTGRRWLYSWIKNPTRYHARTVMPDLFLDPIKSTDADGKVTTSDPVADIVEFLLTDESPEEGRWQPENVSLTELDQETKDTLKILAKLNLRDSFSQSAVDRYIENGIPENRKGEIKIAETEMVITDAERAAKDEALVELVQQKQLLYVGRKAIARLGCYGCHDIPGFEAAKPIGTGLNDWGRKDPTKLAFEHILQYVEHGHGDHHSGSEGHSDDEMHDAGESKEAEGGEFSEDDRSFYENALKHGHRAGFIYQKLREPRSYDYHRTENIKYSERARMPEFPFSDQEREAVITFVLGLVADPPATKFIYQPGPRQKAINEGRVVLERDNCGGCHVLETEKWDISFPQGHFDRNKPAPNVTFPFMLPNFSEDDIERSRAANRQGRIRTALNGMPSIDTTGVPILTEFDEPLYEGEMYNPQTVDYRVDLWQPVLLDGEAWQVGGNAVTVPGGMIERRYPTRGGMLAKYLVPQVVELARQQGSAAASKGKEAWGWVPPPLVGEGGKVQTEWLHDFLLDPHEIRPAVVLRMPKFNMSPAEATKLANYFAAFDNAMYPYEFDQRRRTDHLDEAEANFKKYVEAHKAEEGDAPKNRFDAAMNIVVDKNYCRTCHIIADYDPGGDPKAKAPNLADVYQRLRPDYVRRWIARPAQILPYTGMPENVKYNPQDPVHLGGVSQQLYPGTSVDQLDGLVDLLMNFDRYAKDKLDITSLVKERAAMAMPEAAPTEGGNESKSDNGD